MYLFTRQRRIASGRLRPGMAATLDIAARVKDITELDVQAWTTSMSPGFDTVAWTVMVDRLADIEKAGDKLAADAVFGDTIEAVDGLYSTPLEDRVLQLVTEAPAPGSPEPEYVSVTE